MQLQCVQQRTRGPFIIAIFSVVVDIYILPLLLIHRVYALCVCAILACYSFFSLQFQLILLPYSFVSVMSIFFFNFHFISVRFNYHFPGKSSCFRSYPTLYDEPEFDFIFSSNPIWNNT